MNVKTIEPAQRNNEVVEMLTLLWDKSVRVTHDFLSEKDILNLMPFVEQGLTEIPILAVATDESGKTAGFIGIGSDKVEMLFVSPQYIGKGVGRLLMNWAKQNCGVQYVDVNEQNPYATAVYKHWGFETYERTEFDEQGNPFPILKMRLKSSAVE